MSNIQAALCLAQFERLEVLINKKREIFNLYEKNLKNFQKIKLNKEKSPAKSIYWMTSIFLVKEKFKTKIDAIKFAKILKRRGIDTRPIFPSISTYPMWKQKINIFLKNFISMF